MAVGFLFHRRRAAETTPQDMNTEYSTEFDPRDIAATGFTWTIEDAARLSRVYQQFGLNPEQALAAARADAACGIGQPAVGDTLS
jgi:hypothetical protein